MVDLPPVIVFEVGTQKVALAVGDVEWLVDALRAELADVPERYGLRARLALQVAQARRGDARTTTLTLDDRRVLLAALDERLADAPPLSVSIGTLHDVLGR